MHEDRGTHLRIFSQTTAGGREGSFGSFSAADRVDVVSVPIGWSLSPCPEYGVVLRNLYGEVARPSLALAMARGGVRGFRHVRTAHVEFE